MVQDPERLHVYKAIASNQVPDYHLRHGYFVTRLVKQEEQSKNWEQIRNAEVAFFKNNPDWSDENIQCGTKNLTEKLSEMLCEVIKRR
jgi:hypothetical protein